MNEARRHRAEAFFHLVLARGGDARERAAVKGIERGDDLETPFVVAEASCKFEQSFVRLAAAVAEKNFSRRKVPHDVLREAALRLVVIQI